VVSDPTNVLALECAKRLAKDPATAVRLCTLHQVVRAQALPPQPGFTRHFRMFALAEAGAALPDHAFEVQAIVRHVAVFWRVFDLSASLGCLFPQRRATLFFSPSKKALADRVRLALAASFPPLELVEETFDSAYYDGVRVLFGATSSMGAYIPIADTGLFDWMDKLTSNRRLRLIASGMGIQLIPLLFTTPSDGGRAPVLGSP
jgi:hypothetical protein